MPDLIPFDYSGRQVRTVTINGEPWFVAGDVCAVLSLSNVTAALQRLDPASFTQTEVPNANGHLRPTYVVDESGLYELIIRSDKPEARPFRRWVTAEVLPQIRRTGSYGAVPALPSYADALRQLADQVETTERQARELEAARPAVEFVDRFVQADGNYKIGDVAKVLAIPGLGRTSCSRCCAPRVCSSRAASPTTCPTSGTWTRAGSS